ncbi:MAG: DUF805 domain-containing protein [Alphaproteobacteria bacterium]|nr:DUF805 domain-containing protein [Alphaproteobacteria bacterium]
MSTDNLENQASNNIFEAYVKALRNYFNFKGRTSRYDYWGFWLTDMLVIIIFSVLSVFLKETPAFSSLSDNLKQAYGLLLIIPRIAAIVRRFHDTNKSAVKWILLPVVVSFLFLSGIVAVITDKSTVSIWASMLVLVLIVGLWVCLFRRGLPEDNKYGPAIAENKGQHNKGIIIPIVAWIIPIIAVLLVGAIGGYSKAMTVHKADRTATSVYRLLGSAKGLNGETPIVEENQEGRTGEVLLKGMIPLGGEMNIRRVNGLYTVTLDEVSQAGCEALFKHNWSELPEFIGLQIQGKTDCTSCTEQNPCTLEWIYK